MTSEKRYGDITDPAPDAEWDVWYQDLFDRDTPRQVEVSVWGLVTGLAELWARHLFETIEVDGQKGFSHFNLWWYITTSAIGILQPLMKINHHFFGYN